MEIIVNILVLAPYAGLAELFVKAAEQFEGVKVDVMVANMQDAVKRLRQLEIHPYDMIISRGGTAKLLRAASSLPVLEVEISTYDMLRVIKMAQQYDRRFAIVGYENVTVEAKIISDILKYDIPLWEITSEEHLRQSLPELQKQGYELIVGDVVTVEAAQSLGINCLLITSGMESVKKALAEALELENNLGLFSARQRLYQDILEKGPHMTFLLKKEGVTECFGQLQGAARDLEPAHLEKLKECLRELVPQLPPEGYLHRQKKIAQKYYELHGSFVHSKRKRYSVFYVKELHYNTLPRLQIIRPDEGKNPRHAGVLLPDSRYIGPLLEQARRIPMDTPVLIHGEISTGKNALARYIHRNGENKASSFFEVDCSLISLVEWETLINDMDAPLHKEGYTIYFRGLQNLSVPVQRKLDDYIQSTRMRTRHRLIASTDKDVRYMIAKSLFLPSLLDKFMGMLLVMPGLNERPEDILVLAENLIVEYNLEYGKQVIGFEEGAKELLKNHDWVLNFSELNQTVRQLVMSAKEYYISQSELEMVLRRVNRAPAGGSVLEVNVKKPLAHIEMEVIHRVLEEENDNQTRAAERLGISRSTLWRKLNDSQ